MMADKTINYNFNKPNPITNPDDPFDLKEFISDNLDLIDELFRKKADLIGGKLPTSQLTLDNTPTEESNNPISSGGAKAALDKKQNSDDAFSGDFNDLENMPERFPPSGDFTCIAKAQSNTSYTVGQIRNIILSTADADVNAMQDGEIWIKYV